MTKDILWLLGRVVTGMVAQEILEACEEAAASTGSGGGGSNETNLANPALGTVLVQYIPVYICTRTYDKMLLT